MLSGSSSGDGTVALWRTGRALQAFLTADRAPVPVSDGVALNMVLDDGEHDSHGFSRHQCTMAPVC